MINHNKVVSISQLCFNWAVKTWMLKFKSLKEHKVSCFVDILTFWDLCRVVWWKSPILKFKSQNTTKNACTSAVPCGRRVDGKQCPVLTSRQWTHCISIVPLIVMRPPLLSIETLSFRYAKRRTRQKTKTTTKTNTKIKAILRTPPRYCLLKHSPSDITYTYTYIISSPGQKAFSPEDKDKDKDMYKENDKDNYKPNDKDNDNVTFLDKGNIFRKQVYWVSS